MTSQRSTQVFYAVLFSRDNKYGWSVVPKAELFRFKSYVEYQRGLLTSIQVAVDWLLENVPPERGTFRHLLMRPLIINAATERRLRYQVTHWADELDKW